jgi:hypothetical protein
MRITLRYRLLFLALAVLSILSCNKKTEEFTSEPLSNYLPLIVGKYITYRVDSTVYTNFGRNTEIHSYQIKHSIDALLTDNLGRPAYRVYTFIRDTAGTLPWAPNGTYFVTPLSQSIETVENNLRVVKLQLPVKQGFTWHANNYLPANPYSPAYGFSNDDAMAFWEFNFTKLDETISIGTTSIPNVITVSQIDELSVSDTIFASANTITIPDKTTAVWAKGTGTDSITIIPPSPASVENSFSISNRTNRPLRLNGIPVPVNYNRTYSYRNGQWNFPLDDFNQPIDTIYTGADYAAKNYGIEKYAKNIGLVFREFIMWEFQPTYIGDDGKKTGFGIKMWMIDHN